MNMEQEYSYLKAQHQTRVAEWKLQWNLSPWMSWNPGRSSNAFFPFLNFQCDLNQSKILHFQRRCWPLCLGWPWWQPGGEAWPWQLLPGGPWQRAALSMEEDGKYKWICTVKGNGVSGTHIFCLRTYREPVVPAPSRNFTAAWVSLWLYLTDCLDSLTLGAFVRCLVVDLPWSPHRAGSHLALLGQLPRSAVGNYQT